MNILGLACSLTLGVLLAPLSGDAAQESLKKGKEALENFNYKEAITHLTEAIQKNPKSAEAHYYRGQAYDQEQQFEKAISDFNTAIRLNPKFSEAFFERGRSYFSSADLLKAIADLNEAIRLAPKMDLAYQFRALTYYETGEYAKAIADGKQGVQLGPKNPTHYFPLARMLAVCPDAKLRDGRKAAEYAATACKLTGEKDFQSFEALAAAKAELGLFDEAVRAQKKALELLSELGISSKIANARLKLYEARKPVRVKSFALEWVD